MKRTMLASLPLLVMLYSITPVLRAAPVSYRIDLEVLYVCGPDGGTAGCITGQVLDPRVMVGNVYAGSFTVDSAILSEDGLNKAADVGAFSIVMEDVSWTLGDPSSAFGGFRGPGGLLSSSPGFDVVNGQITNLRGGVLSGGDYPFVDFSTDIRGLHTPDPNCTGEYCGTSPNSFWTYSPLGAFGGSMEVFAVPEPASYALALTTLGAMGIATRRRRPPVPRRGT